MGDVLLNGRKPADWEVPAIEAGRKRERDRDALVVGGLRSGSPPRPATARPVTDLVLEFSGPQGRGLS